MESTTTLVTIVGMLSSYALRRTLLVMIFSLALPYAVQRWDRSRLPPARRARTWNTASWAAALYAFGPLSMIGWCWVTRQDARRWWRENRLVAAAKCAGLLLAGAVAAMIVLALIQAAVVLHGVLSGAPPEW